MCTEFWTIKTDYVCPMCGASQAGELQTHWLGQPGGFMHPRSLGEQVPELRNIAAASMSGGPEDGFVAECRNCHGFIDFAARIENAAVVSIWPVGWEPRSAHPLT
jgi:hypothetical protein